MRRTPQRSLTTQAQEGARQKQGPFCGGFANRPCPEGFTCGDDPNDNCNPKKGGADCGGICQKSKCPPKSPEQDVTACEHPGRTYVAHGRGGEVIRFFCKPGQQSFQDDCGCGCEPQSP